MKNRLKGFLLIIITLICLTGCGNSNSKTLSCSVTNNQDYGKVTSLLEAKIKDNEVKDMSLTLNIEIPEENDIFKRSMISQMRQKTSQVYETKNGIKAVFNMGSSYFNTLGVSKDASYNELKQVLEIQGYTCEE